VVLDTFQALETNLGRDNGLMLDGLQYRLGPLLSFDAKTEKFVGNDRANALLTRPYRPPFVVPEKV
jgi:hypothetical protein